MIFRFCLDRMEPLPVTVEGSYFPGHAGYRNKYGPWEPDQPPEFEIDSVSDEDGCEVEITEDEAEAIVRHGIEYGKTSWEE